MKRNKSEKMRKPSMLFKTKSQKNKAIALAFSAYIMVDIAIKYRL